MQISCNYKETFVTCNNKNKLQLLKKLLISVWNVGRLRNGLSNS